MKSVVIHQSHQDGEVLGVYADLQHACDTVRGTDPTLFIRHDPDKSYIIRRVKATGIQNQEKIVGRLQHFPVIEKP